MSSDNQQGAVKNQTHFPFLPPEPTDDEQLDDYKLHRRFDRMARLVGDPAMKKLMDAHVMVIGLGGVGSYAAEALVRSGVGKITLVDFDLICITNTNRQIHTLKGVIGKPKAEVLAERCRNINPKAEIIPIVKFYNMEHSDEILASRPDWIIDAIDSVTSKCHLLHTCRQEGLNVVCSTGAGGRMDPTQIRVADLADSKIDTLAKSVRKILRRKFGFERNQRFGIPTVFSIEPPTMPHELTYDNGQGFRCVCPQGQNDFFQCDNRNLIMGNSAFVTGTFGFACASVVVKSIAG